MLTERPGQSTPSRLLDGGGYDEEPVHGRRTAVQLCAPGSIASAETGARLSRDARGCEVGCDPELKVVLASLRNLPAAT
jgi:hypothetical protein